LTLESGSVFAIAFTDTNGNYSAAVTPSFWKIGPAEQRLARRAYVTSQSRLQVDATAGSVSNANLAFAKGNALFHGRMADSGNVPFPNVELSAGSGDLKGKGYTDANGNYAVAV